MNPATLTSTAAPLAQDKTVSRLRVDLRKVTVAWLFGSIFFATLGSVVMVRFATVLELGNFGFAVLSALPHVATLLSLPSSVLIDRTGAVKLIFMIAIYAQRFAFLLMAVLPVLLISNGIASPVTVGLWVVLPLFAVINLATALGIPSWVSWMADLVPPRINGRFFAQRSQWGLVSAAPVTLLAGVALDFFAPEAATAVQVLYVCSGIFLVVALIGLVDVFLYQKIRYRPLIPGSGTAPLLSTLVAPLKSRRFMLFTVAAMVITLATAPMALFTQKFLFERTQSSSVTVQMMLIVVPMVAQFIAFPFVGRLGDRYGIGPLVIFGAIGMVPAGAGWLLVGQGTVWIGYPLGVIGAVVGTALEIANLKLLMEFAGSRNNENEGGSASGFAAVNHVVVSIGGIVGSFGAGYLLHRLDGHTVHLSSSLQLGDYDVLFLLSTLLRVAAMGAVLLLLRQKSASLQKRTTPTL